MEIDNKILLRNLGSNTCAVNECVEKTDLIILCPIPLPDFAIGAMNHTEIVKYSGKIHVSSSINRFSS